MLESFWASIDQVLASEEINKSERAGLWESQLKKSRAAQKAESKLQELMIAQLELLY